MVLLPKHCREVTNETIQGKYFEIDHMVYFQKHRCKYTKLKFAHWLLSRTYIKEYIALLIHIIQKNWMYKYCISLKYSHT